MIRSLLAALATAIWPERCPACDALTPLPGLCGRCAQSLYPLGTACPRCAEPQTGPAPITCFRCLRRPPPFDQVRAPYRYGGELATAVRRWKYGARGDAGRSELTRGIAALLAPALASAVQELGSDLIVPVPVHRQRLLERGFSQAVRLASAAHARSLPPVTQALVRSRATPAQAGLGRSARARNVVGAFQVTGQVRGRQVLLVDDILTTGATAAACARVLRRAGADGISVLVLARAEA
jgi:ComF family protein